MKNLRYRNTVFLTNSLGEETGNADIPAPVKAWYCNVSLDTSTMWLEYLVRLDGHYGIALTQEIAHAGCDNNDEYEAPIVESSKDALARVAANAADIDKRIRGVGEVYVGEETGIYGRHELVVFIPLGAGVDQYQRIRKVLGENGVDFCGAV